MDIQRLRPEYYEELYMLMLDECFPDVPTTFEQACAYLNEAVIYGLFQDEKLVGAFIFGDVCDDSAFFDMVCHTSQKGRWATRKTIRKIIDIAFNQLKLQFIWAQPKNTASLKAALKSGFVFVQDTMEQEHPILILSRHNLNKKYLIKTGAH